MLIQITNMCNFACRHCMQDSGAHGEHITPQLMRNALLFAKAIDSKMLVISGGEPTLHPDFLSYVDEVCTKFRSASVATNGSWLLKDSPNHEIGKRLVRMLDTHDNLFIQVCSVPGLYQNSDEITKIFKEKFPEDGPYQSRVFIANKIEAMCALGRAASDEECLEKAKYESKTTTSCFSSAVVGAQLPLKEAIFALEVRGKFCHPMIDCQGHVRWSESRTCPFFGQLPQASDITEDEVARLSAAAHEWRPCGACADYAKLFDPKRGIRYKTAVEMLGLEPPTKTTEEE